MKVCYFGIYNPDYSRNRVLIKGLRENNIEVIECQVNPNERYKYWKLFKKHQQIENYDFMIVGYPGYTVMVLAKLISRKKIIFDAFLSAYQSKIFDRKSYSSKSLHAFKFWLLDWISCKLADKILLDTKEHIKYFVKTFRIEKEKFKRIFIGTDNTLFYPRSIEKKDNKFLVVFHGKYIPLQGTEYIVKAAKILENENIFFYLIGNGQTHQKAVELAGRLKTRNIKFIDFIPQKKLVKYIAQADVCLGIFGDTFKARLVIPNKVYEAIAMGKPVITSDTPAARELLEDKKTCLFSNIADSQDLARKILKLKNNTELRKRIAQNSYRLYKEKLTPKILGNELKNILMEL